jgi:iron-sulfur cluster assembly accessory protein
MPLALTGRSLVVFACAPYIQGKSQPIGLIMLTLPPKVTSRAFARLAEIGAAAQGKALRVAVEGGGCSGFQYEIVLDEVKADDLILEGSGETVVIDSVSLPFLAAAVIDFSEELIGARFVIENPNATSSCGCGTSFSI